MTQDQTFAFVILAGMMTLFIWGRLRYDLVAVLALLAAVFTGIVPHKAAFSGFGDDIVIIVASALVVSAAVARSGMMEAALHRVSPYITSVQGQIVVLVTVVTILSAFVKNIGALAMMIPVAFQMARRSNASPSCFLMPMAFGSLLGGLITLVGTSPNIIVSRVREDLTGQPFGMFDFTPVGVGLAAAGVAFLAFGYRLLPGGRKAAASMDEAINLTDYMTEARVSANSPVVGHTIGDLAKLCDNEVLVTGVVRKQTERMMPLPDVVLREGDIVLLEGDPEALERGVARAHLELEEFVLERLGPLLDPCLQNLVQVLGATLGSDTAGDIQKGRKVLDDAPVLIMDRADGLGRPDLAAIFGAKRHLKGERFVRYHGGPDVPFHLRIRVRTGQKEVVPAQNLVTGIAEKVDEGLLHIDNGIAVNARVGHHHRHAGGLDRCHERAAAMLNSIYLLFGFSLIGVSGF
jgi:hypothetical protein